MKPEGQHLFMESVFTEGAQGKGQCTLTRIISYMEMKQVKIKKWNLHLGAHWVLEKVSLEQRFL